MQCTAVMLAFVLLAGSVSMEAWTESVPMQTTTSGVNQEEVNRIFSASVDEEGLTDAMAVSTADESSVSDPDSMEEYEAIMEEEYRRLLEEEIAEAESNVNVAASYSYEETFQGDIYKSTSGSEVYSGEYAGVNWNITKEGELTLSGTATGKFNTYFSWPDYIAKYNSVQIKKIIVNIAGTNITSMEGWFGSYHNNSKGIQEIVFDKINTGNVTNMGGCLVTANR